MKAPLFLFALIVLTPLSAHSQEKPDPAPAASPAQVQKLSKSEAAAVEAYKADMTTTQQWLTTWQESAAGSEAAALRFPAKIAEHLAKVRTKDLPPNLAKAFAAVRDNQAKHAALLKDLPEDDAAALKWMEKKNADPQFSKALTTVLDDQAQAETLLIEAGASCGAGVESDLYQISGLAQTKDRWVVILGAYKKYPDAKEDALKIAKATNVPFSMRGMVYDKKGLHYPKDLEDEPFAGEYLLRRDNSWNDGAKDLENHISVEISAEYEGFAPGYYIPVGYIGDSAADAEKKAAEFKKFAPGTYVKKTRIYMGCLH